MTLPQECDDITGGVAASQIGDEGGKKARKSFFPGVPNEVCDGRRDQGQRSGALWDPDCCLEPPFQTCRDPLGSPQSSQSLPEPLRGELSPEEPPGRLQPTEPVRQPLVQRRRPPAACLPFPGAGLEPAAPALPAALLTSYLILGPRVWVRVGWG